ncbi:hypothetical protein HAX54_004150, partial [Datura stramonium]|nr:hypothetical protein [Datura stramonium]
SERSDSIMPLVLFSYQSSLTSIVESLSSEDIHQYVHVVDRLGTIHGFRFYVSIRGLSSGRDKLGIRAKYDLEFTRLSKYALEMVADQRAHLNIFLYGVSDSLVRECRTAILNSDLDFSQLTLSAVPPELIRPGTVISQCPIKTSGWSEEQGIRFKGTEGHADKVHPSNLQKIWECCLARQGNNRGHAQTTISTTALAARPSKQDASTSAGGGQR